MSTGNFSKTPADALSEALAQGYFGVHIEQGVPVLDRDVNLLGDLISSALRDSLSSFIGDGCAGGSDLKIELNLDSLDFNIRPGVYLVRGFAIILPAATTYKTQKIPANASPKPPPLTAPTAGQPNPRIDTVYLDMWVEEFDETRDSALGNLLDVGMRTSTRAALQFVVRVAENAAPPAAPQGHVFTPLAQISRSADPAKPPVVTDLRRSLFSLGAAYKRLATIEAALSPVIDSVAPNEVLPGQSNTITISGKNLDLGGPTVMLGPVAGIINPATRPDTLIVAVPSTAPPGTWDVTVQNAVGIGTAPVKIKIDQPPPKPTFAPTGGALPQIAPAHEIPGKTLTLNGSNFTGVTQVVFNANPPAVAQLGGDLVSVTDAVIQVKVPASLTGAVGAPMSLTVTVDGTPAKSGTSDVVFKVDPIPTPRPLWGAPGNQIVPNTRKHGESVTLSGQNFGTSATTTVQFNGTPAVTASPSDIVSVNATTIVVKVPAALVVPAAPNNKCTLTVMVQGAPPSLESNDILTIT